jgi:peroxiredoxin
LLIARTLDVGIEFDAALFAPRRIGSSLPDVVISARTAETFEAQLLREKPNMTIDERNSTADPILPAGAQAPPFTLHSKPGQSFALSDFRGRPVVLVFYPADWSPVCGDQIALYNEMREEFATYGAQVLGISVDGVWCHQAFADARRIQFPLLSDFEPKGEVSRSYGAYDSSDGTSTRALFVLDGNGVIRWSYLSPIDVNPGADGIFAALDQLVAGEESRATDREVPLSAGAPAGSGGTGQDSAGRPTPKGSSGDETIGEAAAR